MKTLFRITPENVSNYNRSTNGYEFIQTVESNEEAYNKVATMEDSDFYPMEDGVVLSASGNEVYSPKYEGEFDFGDYRYLVIEYDSIDSYNQSHIIRAIEAANPHNMDELKAIIQD